MRPSTFVAQHIWNIPPSSRLQHEDNDSPDPPHPAQLNDVITVASKSTDQQPLIEVSYTPVFDYKAYLIKNLGERLN